MKFKLISDGVEKTFALIFDKGDEITATLPDFAKENKLRASHFTAIGAFSDCTLGFFERERKDYKRIPIKEQVEVVSLTGNPVLPIYQPEIAADAIVYAAHHARCEIQVGLPTVVAIEANKIAPGTIDQCLARTNYEAQHTDEPVEADRRDHLWSPVPGDHGSHGSFEARSHEFIPQAWLNTYRGWPLLAGVTGVALGAFLCRRAKCTGENSEEILGHG